MTWIVGFLLLLLFFALFVVWFLEPSAPAIDRRFKTGYKNNAVKPEKTEKDVKIQKKAWLVSLICIVFLLLIYIFSKHTKRTLVDRNNKASYTQKINNTVTTAFVFDPPSNIRDKPNGSVLCVVNNKTNIQIEADELVVSDGKWLKTNYCGQIGFISETQIKRE